MARLQVVLGLVCTIAFIASVTAKPKPPLFDPNKCPNGCQMDDQCAENAECKLLNTGESCGFCVCTAGFQAKGNKCQPIKGYTTTTTSTTTQPTTTTSTTTQTSTTETSTTTTTSTPTTSTTTVPTTTGTTTQSPIPPTPEPVNCADFDCKAAPPPSSSDDPMVVQSSLINTNSNSNCKRQLFPSSRPCSIGGGSCYGTYCLTVSPGNDYCICPYYKIDRQCAVDKPGHCDKATGSVPSTMYQVQGKRLRNQSNKDNGSIYGRHFASTLNECIKLCQWSEGQCRSVNFGQISGANVCEMLSIAATPTNLLAPWLETAAGWTYAQVTN